MVESGHELQSLGRELQSRLSQGKGLVSPHGQPPAEARPGRLAKQTEVCATNMHRSSGPGAQLDLATFERVLNATLGPRAAHELAPRLFAAADTTGTGVLAVDERGASLPIMGMASS